jgi:TonB-linked SusC/RagA family outer membrane protein
MYPKFYSIQTHRKTKWLSDFIFQGSERVGNRKTAKRLIKVIIALCIISTSALAQNTSKRAITGKVHNELGKALLGAIVTEKGTKNSTATDADGKFSLSISPNATLVVAEMGFHPKEVAVHELSFLDIEMSSQQIGLNEVVVTALGIKREKRELTYSTQQLSGDQLTSSKEAGVLNAMNGKVSGVQITTSSGAPGASSRIVIRGNSSLLGNNEALIVLDGVPINNSQTGNANSSGGSNQSRLSDIDPATIESLTVLKGSAASALYGSEAARGVVVITTKGGAYNSKPKVALNSQYSFENAILPQFQDKYALGDRGVYADGDVVKTSAVWGPLISDMAAKGTLTFNQDPLKAFFKTGRTLTNAVSVNGGSDKSTYFFSYSNFDQAGTVPTTAYKRNSFFTKFTNKLTDKISTSFELTYTLSNNHTISEGSDLTDPLWTLYTAPRTYNFLPYLDNTGGQRVFRASRNNPYWNLDNVYNNEKISRVIPVFSVIYKPVNWITVTERLGVDTYSEQTDYYEAPSNVLGTVGAINQISSNYRQFNNDLIAEGRKTFNDFTVSLLVGTNFKSTYNQAHALNGTGTSILGFDNIANAATINGSENYYLTRKIGFYAQSNIGYKGYLNLSLTGRYDGTSVLASGKNFYPYGSASMGFTFSELLNAPAISFGKLRVSYSSVGNDNINPYKGSTPYNIATSFPYNGNSGFLLSSTLGNPNLVNESTNEAEVGLEMNFLQNRIGFEVSYFDRHHNNLLASNIPIAPSSGFSATSLNAGDMTNKGIEALLNVSPFKSKNFGWDITFNYTKIKNMVTRVNGITNSLQLGNTWAFVGQPYGVFYNTGYVRNDAGQLMIDDKGLPIVSAANENIGNLQPDYQAGMTNKFRLGQFSLSFFLDFKKGGDVLNSDDRYGFFYGTPKVTENREDRVIPGIVSSTGQPNTKSISAEDYYQRLNLIYEAAIQDATFLKLRNASIGYNLSEKLLQRTPFSSVSFTVTGRNLFIYAPHFTGSDPEVSAYGTANGSQGIYGNSIPSSRSINFAINAAFK